MWFLAILVQTQNEVIPRQHIDHILVHSVLQDLKRRRTYQVLHAGSPQSSQVFLWNQRRLLFAI